MITVARLAIGQLSNFFVNWRPGIYQLQLDGVYNFIASQLLIDVPTFTEIREIGSVFVDNAPLASAQNTDELTQGPSFFYEVPTRTLFVRLPDYDAPLNHRMVIGPNYAFATDHYIDEVTGQEFDGRLNSTFNIEKSKDPLFFGRLRYQDFTLEIENGDGFFYQIQDWDIFGQPVSISVGEQLQNQADFVTIKTGRVRDYSFIGERVIMNIEDSRRTLDRNVPETLITTDDYPTVKRGKGKYKPLVYGRCLNVPCQPLDDDARDAQDRPRAEFYTFSCADTTYHSIMAVRLVYVDGAEVDVHSVDLDEGTFTLRNTFASGENNLDVYKPGQRVTADIDGYTDTTGTAVTLIENPLDVVRDLIQNYLQVPFGSLFYDVTTWNEARQNQPAINYCIDRRIKLQVVIQQICSSLLNGIDIDVDNRLTWLRRADSDRSMYYVAAEDWVSPPDIVFDSSESISSALVEYNRDWATGDPQTVENNDYFEDFVQKFKGPKDGTFETVLTDDLDAEALAARIANAFQDVQIFIEGDVNINVEHPRSPILFSELRPGDNLGLEVDDIQIINKKIVRSQFLSLFTCELINISINTETETASIRARFIANTGVVKRLADGRTKVLTDGLVKALRSL